MPTKRQFTPEESGALVETLSIGSTSGGPLGGLRFGVKDLIDIAGHRTGCGNPTWRDTHPLATAHAVCVEQLLAAGAQCVGKTVTDELAFSLIGENHFFGTPLNPSAPTRVPGGSSSGSASAVACGLADFALGTDTGGSVRVPSSNCGVWGLRPSHGIISVAGVMPFAPGFDTVGILASNGKILEEVAAVLLAAEPVREAAMPTIHLLDDAFALIDADVREALAGPVNQLHETFQGNIRSTTLQELCGDGPESNFDALLETYRVIQHAEIGSCLGAWIAEAKPTFGPSIASSFELVKNLDRSKVAGAIRQREFYCRCLSAALGPRDLLCMPTVPGAAPLKSACLQGQIGHYYGRALSLTSLAGLCRLPQVTMPLANTPDSPVGLSLLGAHGQDMFALSAARRLAREPLPS